MRAFEPPHLAWLFAIAVVAVSVSALASRHAAVRIPLRALLATALAAEELFRYVHDGIHFPNKMPVHLCTAALWATVIAMIRPRSRAVEFAYYIGIPASALALLTPDLHAAWNSYDAIRYFLEHGLLVVSIAFLVFGGVATLKPRGAIRGFEMLVGYGLFLLAYNLAFGTNYMYLRRKPNNPTPLDYMGPWPLYLLVAIPVAAALVWLMWLPVRARIGAENEAV